MAVELFFDDAALQSSVSVNCSFNFNVVESNMMLAAEQWIIPCIGEDFYEVLKTGVINESLTTEQKKLVNRLMKALAHFGLYLHIEEGAVQWGDAGITRRENDNNKTAYKYQENNLRNTLIRKGWEWMEITLNFLEKNETDYPQWEDEFKFKNRCFFINTGKEFSNIIHLKDGRYLYELLKGIMEDVECFSILSKLGDEFFQELKLQIKEKNLTAENSKLIPYIQKIVAYFTKAEAIKLHPFGFTVEGLINIQQGTNDGKQWIRTPSKETTNTAIVYNETMANRHMDKLCDFLEKNRGDYPLHTTFLEEEQTVQEEINIEECCTRSCSCGKRICTCKSSSDEFILIL